MTAVVLYRIDPAKRMHRFYRLDVQQDLFGLWCVICEWGRIGAAGRGRSKSFSTQQEAEAALEKQRREKEGRGYQLV